MSRLTDLIAQAKAKDLQMGADLEREFRALSSRLSFGLNFERHRPEAVELPQRPIRKGDKVRVLPERGSTKKGDSRLLVVRKITKEGRKKLAELVPLDAGPGTADTQKVALDNVVVVAEFRDTRRTARPNLFYPIFFSMDGTFHSAGRPLSLTEDKSRVVAPRGTIAVFPTATNGTEMTWALTHERIPEYVREGFAKFGKLRADAPQPVRIYYLTEGYVEAIVRPDFLFFCESANGSVVVDIVDPHGTHLADALPKLRGLARYAETHPGIYRRIESVAEADGKLRVLDLTREDVRKAIAAAKDDAVSLYGGALASEYR